VGAPGGQSPGSTRLPPSRGQLPFLKQYKRKPKINCALLNLLKKIPNPESKKMSSPKPGKLAEQTCSVDRRRVEGVRGRSSYNAALWELLPFIVHFEK
jgi:hypothetical protein